MSDKSPSVRSKQMDGPLREGEQEPERRFEARRSTSGTLTLVGTALGGLALGAGVYGQWVLEPVPSYARWVVAAGGLCVAAVVLWGRMQDRAVRVGSTGVAIESGGRVVRRIYWFEMTLVRVGGGEAVIEAGERRLTLSVRTDPQAVAQLVAEIRDRRPHVLQIEEAALRALPAVAPSDGKRVMPEPRQSTGARCASTGKPILFERDARCCRRCAQVYHVDGIPDRCVSCDQPFGT